MDDKATSAPNNQQVFVMNDRVFVGRDEEIAILTNFFQKTYTDRVCQVGIIAGDAGTGKTTLAENFAHEIIEQYPETVIAAIGKCNAQTGPQDTYLPFREVLDQLTGRQVRAFRGSGSNRPFSIDRTFVVRAKKALAEHGLDLIGTFVPAKLLLEDMEVFDNEPEPDKLRNLVQSRSGNQEAKREEVYSQYSAVLRSLSQSALVILIIDDLQWASETSLDLFVHLAEDLRDSSVMLIGIRRVDSDSFGKDNILITKINHLKAQYGEIVIDLSPNSDKKKIEFLELFFKSQRFKASSDFMDNFFRRTGGNALFTVELFRYFHEHKLLEQDENGNWVADSKLDWSTTQLPRLDGLIQTRLDGLSDELREILNIASIQGQDFTAQVVKKLMNIGERQVLQKLSTVLDKQYNLVSEISEISTGSVVVSNYRFVNATYHQHIYESMGLGERRLLHEQVAGALEDLYKSNLDEVALQLAHHYELAYKPEKVVEFLNRAAGQLAKVSQLGEAENIFGKALAIAKITNSKKGVVDSLRFIAGDILIPRGDFQEAEKLLLEAQKLAQNIDHTDGLIYVLRQLGIVARKKGYLTTATRYYMESYQLAVEEEKKKEEAKKKGEKREGGKGAIASAFNNLGTAAMEDRAYDEAERYFFQRLDIANEANDKNGRLFAFLNLGDLEWRRGDFEWQMKQKDKAVEHWGKGKDYLRTALKIGEETGRKSQQASARKSLGDIATSEGNFAEAAEHFVASLKIVINAGEKPKIVDNLVSIARLLWQSGQDEAAFRFSSLPSKSKHASLFDKRISNHVIDAIRESSKSIDIETILRNLDDDEDPKPLGKEALEILKGGEVTLSLVREWNYNDRPK